MLRYGLPIAYALFVWWFSTGVIIYLDGLPRRTFRWTLMGATLLLGVALYGLSAHSGNIGVTGAYASFTCGVLVWAWVEVGFLMGPVTGPRKQPCPPGCTGWRRAGLAIQAILYHELAIIGLAGVLALLSWGAANQVGLWTYLVLWAMRLSAKLNVFLGVRNLGKSFLPEHLTYLGSFFRQQPMNLLFPFCVTGATVVMATLVQHASAAGASDFEAAGFTFAATMLMLAILEHWLLVVPLPETLLWRWSLTSHIEEPAQRAAAPASGAVPAPANTPAPDAPGRAFVPARPIFMPAQGRWR
jgi:putative photosynthetic complex assembly protein 2